MAGKILPCEKCYPIRNRVHEPIEKLIHAEEEGSGKNFRWVAEKNWIKSVNLVEDVQPNIIILIILKEKNKYIKVLLGVGRNHTREWSSNEHELTTPERYQKGGEPKVGLSYFGVRSKIWFTPPETSFFLSLETFSKFPLDNFRIIETMEKFSFCSRK